MIKLCVIKHADLTVLSASHPQAIDEKKISSTHKIDVEDTFSGLQQ